MIAPVLLIDDDLSLATAYRSFLEAEAIPVVLAKTQDEALAALEVSTQFSLLLVDFRMPGLPGEDFYHLLRGRFPSLGDEVPIAVFSSHSESSPVATKIRALGGLYMEKPYDIDQFLQRVKEMLRRPAPA